MKNFNMESYIHHTWVVGTCSTVSYSPVAMFVQQLVGIPIWRSAYSKACLHIDVYLGRITRTYGAVWSAILWHAHCVWRINDECVCLGRGSIKNWYLGGLIHHLKCLYFVIYWLSVGLMWTCAFDEVDVVGAMRAISYIIWACVTYCNVYGSGVQLKYFACRPLIHTVIPDWFVCGCLTFAFTFLCLYIVVNNVCRYHKAHKS